VQWGAPLSSRKLPKGIILECLRHDVLGSQGGILVTWGVNRRAGVDTVPTYSSRVYCFWDTDTGMLMAKSVSIWVLEIAFLRCSCCTCTVALGYHICSFRQHWQALLSWMSAASTCGLLFYSRLCVGCWNACGVGIPKDYEYR